MGIKIITTNRKASFEYFILETLECGIVLTGTEIKSIRDTKININDSYGQIKNGELILFNTVIGKYKEGNINNHEEDRNRTLLVHKSELRKWYMKLKTENNLTLIPLKVYLNNGLCKVEMGLCRGKKLYDKRESLKEADIKRHKEKIEANLNKY